MILLIKIKKNYIKVRNILMNSECLQYKISIDFKSNIAYEIYNIIQKTYKKVKTRKTS